MLSINLKKIRNAIGKKDYEKANELVERYFSDSPKHPGVLYYKSFLHFEKNSASYNVDSARTNIQKAIKFYEGANLDFLEDLEKNQLTLSKIISLRDTIRNFEIDSIYKDITVKAITNFLNNYPENPHKNKLIFSRDSLTYLKLRETKNIDRLENFIEQNPNSSFKSVAFKTLDSLRFTKIQDFDDKMELMKFLKRTPKTYYRTVIENRILDVELIRGCKVGCKTILNTDLSKKIKTKATNILYHFDSKNFNSSNPNVSDSLKKAISLSS